MKYLKNNLSHFFSQRAQSKQPLGSNTIHFEPEESTYDYDFIDTVYVNLHNCCQLRNSDNGASCKKGHTTLHYHGRVVVGAIVPPRTIRAL